MLFEILKTWGKTKKIIDENAEEEETCTRLPCFGEPTNVPAFYISPGELCSEALRNKARSLGVTVNDLFIAAVNVAYGKVIPAEQRVKKIKIYCPVSAWSSTDFFQPGNKVLDIVCIFPAFDSVTEAAKAIK